MIPFFVADRPMSLRILKGLNLKDYPGVKIGIMAHANTSDNFQKAFRDYPCEDLERCDAIGAKPCLYKTDKGRNRCKHRKLILERTVRMCDSGVFTKEGAMLSYEELFAAYDRMNVEYGIMIDVLHDAFATIKSAKEAKKVYELGNHKFNLVVVAQGETEQEYLDCYSKLNHLGFEHIAIGGLLRRNQNTVRYVKVGSEKLLFDILEKIKKEHSPNWLFALGCLNPKRVEKLQKLNVWADYKGWIFQYKKRNQSLNSCLDEFEKNYCDVFNNVEQDKFTAEGGHSQALPLQGRERVTKIIKEIIHKRNNLIADQNQISKELHQGKKELRKELKNILDILASGKYISTPLFSRIVNRGFFSPQEQQIVIETFKEISRTIQAPAFEAGVTSSQNTQGHKEASRHATSLEKIVTSKEMLDKAEKNCQLNKNKKNIEKQINQYNQEILKKLKMHIKNDTTIASNTKTMCNEVINLIEKSEHNYRLEQVRDYIEQEILKLLKK